MPSQSFEAIAVASASVSEAWQALQQPATWEGIAGVESVESAVHDAEGKLVEFAFTASVGGVRYSGTSKALESVEPEHVHFELTTSEVAATVRVGLEPGEREGATQVHVALTLQSRSFLAGMFFPAIVESIGRGLPSATADFAARLG